MQIAVAVSPHFEWFSMALIYFNVLFKYEELKVLQNARLSHPSLLRLFLRTPFKRRHSQSTQVAQCQIHQGVPNVAPPLSVHPASLVSTCVWIEFCSTEAWYFWFTLSNLSLSASHAVMQSQAWMLAKCRSQLYVHASIPISCQDWFWFSAKVSLTVCVGSSVTGRFRSFHLRVHVCRPTSERTRHWPFGCCPQLRFQDINTSICQCAQSQRGFLRAYARMHHTKAGGFKFRRSAFRCEEPKAWCNCHKFGSSTFNRSLFLGALFFLRANKY